MSGQELPELWGIEINGCIYRQNGKPLDPDEFADKFLEFIESQNWYFGGGTTVVDLNHPPKKS